MEPHALREYFRRDRDSVATAKLEYWGRVFRDSPQIVWESAQALLAHVREIRATYPSDAERDADLRDHLALRARLDRAADALSRR